MFESRHCAEIADPKKPTIMIVGDSHASVLFVGLEREFGARANIIAMTATYCMPLIENTPMDRGRRRHAALPGDQPICVRANSRDQAGYSGRGSLFRLLRLGSRLALSELFQRFPRQCASPPQGRGEKHRHRRADPDMVALRCPSSSGSMSRTARRRRKFPRVGLRPEFLAADAQLQELDWGPGATYVSQAAPRRRMPPPRRRPVAGGHDQFRLRPL